jgi:hypothetical protein
MEQFSGPLAVEIFPGKQESTAISALILQRERELSLMHVQRCTFLILEQSCGPLAVEFVPGNHCDFRTYLAKRRKAKSGACAEVQFPDYGTVLCFPGSRIFSRKALRFRNLFGQERRFSLEQRQMCSFLTMEQCCHPLAVEIAQRNTAISETILPRERELSLAHAQGCSFLIMEQSSGPRQ